MAFNKDKLKSNNNFFNSNQNNTQSLNSLIGKLSYNYITFEKKYNFLVEYNKKLSSSPSENHEPTKFIEAKKEISSVKEIINEINSNLILLEKLVLTEPSFKSKIYDTINMFNKKMQSKRDVLNKVINEIHNKELLVNKDMNENSMTNDSTDNIEMKTCSLMIKNEVNDIVFHENLSNNRKIELEEIFTVSNQVKEMTKYMKTTVNKQGEVLSK